MPCRGPWGDVEFIVVPVEPAKTIESMRIVILQAQPNQAKPFTQQGSAKYRG